MCNWFSLFKLSTYVALVWRKLYPLGCNSISVLVLTSCNILITTIFQSAWPQLDISPRSCQTNSVIRSIDSTLFGGALFTAPSCFCLAYIFDNIIKSVGRKVNQLYEANEAIHQRILLYNNLVIALELLYSTIILLMLKPIQQFLSDTFNSNLLRWEISYDSTSLLLTLFLRLSVITKISYSYCDITITYSTCVQYSHATVDLILMAVDQKDVEHWKEPAVHTSWGILPYYPPLDTEQTISKSHISIKHMNFMHKT